MGLGMWVIAGLGAFALARVIRSSRGPWLPEALAGVAAAMIAGLAATALDFGGWKERDWRAGLFSLLVAFSAIGSIRVIGMMSRRRSNG